MRNRSAICQHQSNPLVIYSVLYKNEQAILGSNSLSYVDYFDAKRTEWVYTQFDISRSFFFQLVVIHLVLYPNFLSLVSTEQWNDGTLMFASMFCLIYCFGIAMMAHKSKTSRRSRRRRRRNALRSHRHVSIRKFTPTFNDLCT